MSTHNIGFYEDLTKIIFELSSNMHLISSAAVLQTAHKRSFGSWLLNNQLMGTRFTKYFRGSKQQIF